ncbi:MAG: hypothetical protein R3F34_01340 [Planctomycetota bacterium]
MSHRSITTTCALLVLAGTARAQLVGPPVEIGTGLPTTSEASGIAWHEGREQWIVVGDEGLLAALSPGGAVLTQWSVPGDLEAVCVADPNRDRVYLAREQPDAVLEFDLVTGTVLRVFDVSAWFPGPSNDGVEALTFVPDANDPEGGLFWAGSSLDGTVHRFRLPILSSATSNQVLHVDSFVPSSSKELRGLDADPVAGVVYALYSDPPAVRVLGPSGNTLANWPVPAAPGGARAEGVGVRGCELALAEDAGRSGISRVERYSGVDAFSPCRTLEADVAGVSVIFGGAQHLVLDAGPARAGDVYLFLGSRTLGNPGIVDGDLVLPLVVDDYFLLTLYSAGPPVLDGFFGVLDAQGHGSATIAIPSQFGPAAALLGKRLHHAAVVFDLAALQFVHASNPVALRFTF